MDSSATDLGLILTPTSTVQRHLAAAALDARCVTALYGALLTGKIYAKDLEIVLGANGPYVEYISQPTVWGPTLVLFTSRDRFEPGMQRVEVLPFTYLLELLPRGVALLIDPLHEAFLIDPDTVAMLARFA